MSIPHHVSFAPFHIRASTFVGQQPAHGSQSDKGAVLMNPFLMKCRVQPHFALPPFLILLLLATHFAAAQKVRVDWDREVDFSQYKTFSWGIVTTINDLRSPRS
jgi:hypothetical protein